MRAPCRVAPSSIVFRSCRFGTTEGGVAKSSSWDNKSMTDGFESARRTTNRGSRRWQTGSPTPLHSSLLSASPLHACSPPWLRPRAVPGAPYGPRVSTIEGAPQTGSTAATPTSAASFCWPLERCGCQLPKDAQRASHIAGDLDVLGGPVRLSPLLKGGICVCRCTTLLWTVLEYIW
jgi:hypothetical protein